MDAALTAEIVAKGNASASITEIIGFANSLKKSNISKETSKINRSVINEVTTNVFNDL